MKKISPFWITFILVAIVVCSWLFFPILTWGSLHILRIAPLFLLLLQIFLTFQLKKRNLLWLLLFNCAAFLVLFNIIKASINYVRGKPTIIKTCCCAGWEPDPEDEKKLIYIDYFDDDCGDWAGSYYYTLNINNGVTEGLINLFGNPVKYKHSTLPKK